ncbi:MAG: dihydroorotase [Oscillospiraceae bacterium]|jgi:dihydroorotase|nr:dihydroorotase [Oscillospiraceae bacterium]
MYFLLKNANVYAESTFKRKNVYIENGYWHLKEIDYIPDNNDVAILDFNGYHIFPGLVDVHVHLREPGFFYKESIKSGTAAAARSGYTDIFSMPNLNPVPDNLENLKVQLEIIKNDSLINVHPYGSITKGENGKNLSNMNEIASYVAGFSDDGHGVRDYNIIKSAMITAKKLGKIIVSHCENNSLIGGGYIHKGKYSEKHGHKGICSESEWMAVERELKIAKEVGCKYHVCHVSAKESVNLIRKAKSEGVDVTCETAPHYLLLNDMNIKEDGKFKMNPPIRSEEDRLALIEGIKNGTIDMIATDHAPHSAEEKSKGLKGSLMGVAGIETAFPILYTKLVKTNILPLSKLIELMSVNPSKRFGISNKFDVGGKANLCIFNLNQKYKIDPEKFISKGKSTPFEGEEVYGKCVMTICDGKVVWQEYS